MGGWNWLWAGQPCCIRDLATWLSLCVCLFQSFLPDPILRLKGVIGFGGHSTKWVRSSVLLLGPTSISYTEQTAGRHRISLPWLRDPLGSPRHWVPALLWSSSPARIHTHLVPPWCCDVQTQAALCVVSTSRGGAGPDAQALRNLRPCSSFKSWMHVVQLSGPWCGQDRVPVEAAAGEVAVCSPGCPGCGL